MRNEGLNYAYFGKLLLSFTYSQFSTFFLGFKHTFLES